jgi:hypothetical protein
MCFGALSLLIAKPASTIDVFYKNQPPSLKTLEKVLPVLNEFSSKYSVNLHCITDTLSTDLIQEYQLPATHFPFAVVINGMFSAEFENKKIDFIHFPEFMHGIGRHEGNWSLEQLKTVLNTPKSLCEKNILPILKDVESSTCSE